MYTEEEQAGFLARAAELLAQVVSQGQEDNDSRGGGELANDAAAYMQRVESLAKNKRTRHAP